LLFFLFSQVKKKAHDGVQIVHLFSSSLQLKTDTSDLATQQLVVALMFQYLCSSQNSRVPVSKPGQQVGVVHVPDQQVGG
jgi:hypothetical protein